MNDPSVAVLCVTHARPELARKCLASCASQDYPNLEIVVVVNPVDPATEAAVRESAPEARIVRTHRNLGFFPALNIALASTDADYVMIVDDDAWFLEDSAVRHLVGHFMKTPELGAITCNLEGPNETPIKGGDRYIRAFTTGFTMLPRKVFTQWVGYFPDVFFRSAGETYVCYALWDQGRPVKRVEAVRMYHALAMEGRSMRDWNLHSVRSQVLCAIMREPIGWLFPVMISKLVKSFLAAPRRGGFGLWMRAWASALLHLGEALEHRAPISHQTRRLLARLDGHPIRDLTQVPEWKKRARGPW